LEAGVRYASPSGVDTNDCSQAAPCTLSKAYSIVDVGHPWLRMLPGTYESVQITVTNAVRIIGTGATLSPAAGQGSAIAMGASGDANIRGLTLAHGPNTTGTGMLTCIPPSGSATLVLRDVTSNNPSRTALAVAANCTLTVTASAFVGQTNFNENSTSIVDRSSFTGHVQVMTNQPTAGISLDITNSIFVDPQLLPSLSSTASGQRIYIASSTFYSSTTSPACDCPAGSNPATVATYVNNIFYAPASTNAFGTTSSCTADTNVVYPQTASAGTNAVVQDPKLVDAANGNFHLMAGSPAIDAAKPTSSDPTVDFDGTARPQGARNDIGAFEFKP
jgi:hypothetical protein